MGLVLEEREVTTALFFLALYPCRGCIRLCLEGRGSQEVELKTDSQLWT